MTDATGVVAHYTSGTLLERIEAGLKALGVTPPVPLEVLAMVDEFHVGGRAATVPFLDRLGLAPGMAVLDMGCGIGGPARFAAQNRGVHVTGIDLTAEFVGTARALSEMTGLSGQVELVQGSITDMPFAAGQFDAAWMIHVGMNIADKHAIATEAARVLKPGACFGIYDVMRAGAGEIAYPVPWAAAPGTSALATPAQYRAALVAAGFEIVAETDRTGFAEAFFDRLAGAQSGADGPPPLGLHLAMGESTPVKIANMVANIRARYIAPVEIIARAPG
jgi:SAM-dependent methyltransferase